MGTEVSKRAQPDVDPDIIHEGTRITLPADPTPMTTEKAIKVLERKLKDEMQELDVSEKIDGHPFDALVAFSKAMKQVYGWASPVPTMTFFGPVKPDIITIKTGPKEEDKVQYPYGSFVLPNVEKPIQVQFVFHSDAEHFLYVSGTVRKKEQKFLTDLCAEARAILKRESIFKGKAIRLKCDEDGTVDFNDIDFLETDDIKPDQLILNPDELEQVVASIWTPIKHTKECEALRVPLNRGVLLEGTYGTGKTMTAHVTSKVCTDNGWTYILLDKVQGLKDTLLFAQRYQPCVIFAEDIDRVIEERDEDGNDLLNTIDGVLTKNAKVITVLTTNHVEKLDAAMLRPGRLDAVISVRPPEEEAVKKLIRLYGANLIDTTDDLTETAQLLAGNIPATIREVVERSKLSMIAHGNERITDADLRVSAIGMTRHLELLNKKPEVVTPEEAVGRSLKALLTIDGEDASDQISNAIQRSTGKIDQVGRGLAAALHEHKMALAGSMQATDGALRKIIDDTAVIKKAVAR